jgi:hypothetical protein
MILEACVEYLKRAAHFHGPAHIEHNGYTRDQACQFEAALMRTATNVKQLAQELYVREGRIFKGARK